MNSKITVGPDGIDQQSIENFWEDYGDRVRKQNVSTASLTKEHTDVLANIIADVGPVDFHLAAEMGNTAELKSKHLIVSVIEELLKLTKAKRYRLCVRHNATYVYNGMYWKRIEDAEFRQFLGKVAGKMGMQPVDAKYYLLQEQLYKQFLAAATLPAPEPREGFVLINLKNGTYEIHKNEHTLRAFSPNDFLTYQLNFDYNIESEAPLFEQYLERVLPEKELQHILAEFIGYVFAKDLKLEKCLLLYGSGANGKSVFFEIISALLGKENISTFSLANLDKENNRALIEHKLLNYGSEIRAGIERDTFKALASGEPIQAKLLYKNSIFIRNYARLCFNCNELPHDVEHSTAFFRRFLIIPFRVTIPEEERDPQLCKKIINEELSGIFNWVLEGLERLLTNGNFTPSKIIDEMLNEYKLESDSVYQFITDSGYKNSSDPGPSLKTSYEEYSRYCTDSGYQKVSKKKFAKRLRHHEIAVERSGAGGHTFVYYSK